MQKFSFFRQESIHQLSGGTDSSENICDELGLQWYIATVIIIISTRNSVKNEVHK